MFYTYCTITIEQAKVIAGKNKKVMFYANPNEGILLSAKQFENLAKEKIDMNEFNSWLDEAYCASEVINKSPEFYEKLKKEFIEYSIETITEKMLDGEWIEVEYTIE